MTFVPIRTFCVINVRICTFFIQIRNYEFIEQAARAKPEHSSLATGPRFVRLGDVTA